MAYTVLRQIPRSKDPGDSVIPLRHSPKRSDGFFYRDGAWGAVYLEFITKRSLTHCEKRLSKLGVLLPQTADFELIALFTKAQAKQVGIAIGHRVPGVLWELEKV